MVIHIRYIQNYIGDRRYPLDSLRYKSDYLRRKEMRNDDRKNRERERERGRERER